MPTGRICVRTEAGWYEQTGRALQTAADRVRARERGRKSFNVTKQHAKQRPAIELATPPGPVGDTLVATIHAIIADELVIAVNHKTSAVRIIIERNGPVPGKGPGETVEWGGLLGTAIVQDPGRFCRARLFAGGGRVPASIQGYRA